MVLDLRNYIPALKYGATFPASQLAGFVKVLDRSQVDGVADEVQINSAINELASAGGGALFLKGSFTTSSPILMKSNVKLIGEGMGYTTITGTSSDYGLARTTLSGTTKTVYSDILVRDITFSSKQGSCLVFNNTDGVTVERCEFTFTVTTPIRQGLFIQHCKNVSVTDNYAHDLTGNGLSVTSTDNFIISNNIIIGGANSDDGIDVDFDFLDTSAIASNDGTITGNVVKSIGRGNGIRVENSSNVTVVSNQCSDVTATNGAGITINVTGTNTVRNVVVSGNQVNDCTDRGITVEKATGATFGDVIVSNNIVYTCGADGGSNVRAGIYLAAPNVACTGNIVNGTAKTGTDGAAIVLYKQNDIQVTNNTIRGSVVGIRAWNGDAQQSYSGLMVTGNVLRDNTTDLVNLDAPANSLVDSNLAY